MVGKQANIEFEWSFKSFFCGSPKKGNRPDMVGEGEVECGAWSKQLIYAHVVEGGRIPR